MTTPPTDPQESGVPDPQQDPDRRERRRDRRVLGWILGVLVVAAVGLYVAAYAFAGEHLPRGTEVAGVGVGGLRVEAAERRVAERIADDAESPLTVAVGGETFTIVPAEAGLSVDVEASVAQVETGRSWSPERLWQSMFGGVEVPAVVDSDVARLERALRSVARRTDVEVVEGAVTFEATGSGPGGAGAAAVATYPRRGSVLDLDAAATALEEAFPGGGPVTLEPEQVEPELTEEAVRTALRTVARPAVCAPVGWDIGGVPVMLRPADLVPVLSMAPQDGDLVLKIDEKALRKKLDPALRTVEEEPVDATVTIRNGQPQVVPAQPGIAVDREALVDQLPELLRKRGAARTGQVEVTITQPEKGAGEAGRLGVKELVSEFTTYYPHADYRNTNIGRAAALVDGTLLRPGETFSLNETVGERTAENGFTEGFIISDGVFREELGGGVSQVATTTFNAAFFAGLEDVEHKPHSFYIDRYPVGREATVAWPSVDLRFRNDTRYGVLLQTVHRPSGPGGQGSITVRMWSTKVWDIQAVASERYAYTSPGTRRISGPECVPNEGYSGFQIDVTRVFRRAGDDEVVRRERMHTTYTPSDTVVCTG